MPLPLLSRGLGSVALGPLSLNLSFLAIVAVMIGSVYREPQDSGSCRRRSGGHRRASGDLVEKPCWCWSCRSWRCLAALGFHLDYPAFKGFNFTGGIAVPHAFTALLVALSLYTATYIAESVRAGHPGDLARARPRRPMRSACVRAAR